MLNLFNEMQLANVDTQHRRIPVVRRLFMHAVSMMGEEKFLKNYELIIM
jgi:hypothetical protein